MTYLRPACGPLPHADGTTTFRLWAPDADAVVLALSSGGEHEVALQRWAGTPGERGWWRVRLAAGHGDDYGFRVDGGPVLPDPGSRWQPAGVHGRSRVVDTSRFSWSAGEDAWRAAPLSGAVIYELHVGTFTREGTFAAAGAHLERLADLGITHVEVMPVNAFNGPRGWGYDGVAWYAVHEPYGGPLGFARFVDACHAAGLAVILDVVYNHLGPSGNYLPAFGPYLTDRYATPWGAALNLDGPGSDEVRDYLIGNALYWLEELHVDGLRLDAVHGLIDTSAVHVLREMAMRVELVSQRLRRPLPLIAESDRCDPRTIRPVEAGGTGMAAQWSDDLHHAIHTAVTGEREGYYVDYRGLRDVPEAYRRGFLFDGSRFSRYRQRSVGAPLGDIPGHRLVTCTQNHDQVGNRAAGERLTALVVPALRRVAAVLLCAAPTTPMLFMGEEFGASTPFQYFTSHPEPELAEAVRRGRREEFASFGSFTGTVPDPQDPDTFARSTLDWEESTSEEAQQRWTMWRDLLAIRRRTPALANSLRDHVVTVSADERWLALLRRDPYEATVLLTVNLASEPVSKPVPLSPSGAWEVLFDSNSERYGGPGTQGACAEPDDHEVAVTVPGGNAILWRPVAA